MVSLECVSLDRCRLTAGLAGLLSFLSLLELEFDFLSFLYIYRYIYINVELIFIEIFIYCLELVSFMC